MSSSTQGQLADASIAVSEAAGAVAAPSTKWSTQCRIPDANTTKGPALAALGERLYAAWRGVDDDDQQVWYASFDGTAWSKEKRKSSAQSAAGPALCTWNGQLVMAWRGKDTENIFFSFYDGSRWTPVQELPTIDGKKPKASRSPVLSAVIAGGKERLVLACERGGQVQIYQFNGTTWSAREQPTVKVGEGPAIVGRMDRCYLAIVDTKGALRAYRFPELDEIARIGGNSDRAPALSRLGDTIHVVWSDPRVHHALWHSTFEHGGRAWTPPRQIAGMGTTDRPALTEWHGELHMAWRGLENEICHASFGNPDAPYQNLPVADLPAAFVRIPKDGRKLDRYGFEWDNSLFDVVPHVQGMGIYNDYYIFSHSQEVGKGPGRIIVGNARVGGKCRTYEVTTPEGFHHPSGLQVIGNYMVLGVEFSDDSQQKDTEHQGSWLYFYDLSTITDSHGPTLLTGASIRRPVRGAAAVAMTRADGRYVLATYGSEPGGLTFIHRSNRRVLGDPDLTFGEPLCSFRPVIDGDGRGYDNLALLTTESQQVFLVGLRGEDSLKGAVVNDYADLFHVNLDGTDPKHVKTVQFDTTTGGLASPGLPFAWAHFRFGATVSVRERKTLVLRCTNRNLDLTGEGAQMNLFQDE